MSSSSSLFFFFFFLWVRVRFWKNIEILREILRTGGSFPGSKNYEKNRDIFPKQRTLTRVRIIYGGFYNFFSTSDSNPNILIFFCFFRENITRKAATWSRPRPGPKFLNKSSNYKNILDN